MHPDMFYRRGPTVFYKLQLQHCEFWDTALVVLCDTQRFIYSNKERGKIVITNAYTWDLADLQVSFEVLEQWWGYSEHRLPISSSIYHDFTALPPQGQKQVSSGERQNRTSTYN